MSGKPRGATVVWHRDGVLESRNMYLPGWALTLIMVASGLFVLGIAALIVLYVPIAGVAASVPGLKRDIVRLESDNAKVRELAQALDHTEARYNQLREMLGADIVINSGAFATPLPVAPAVVGRLPGLPATFEPQPSVPSHWPLDVDGYITRGQVGTGSRREAHLGIDVAVPIGSVVRAAGGGRVIDAGKDDEYGNFVRLAHPDGLESMYGHLSRITAVAGGYVPAGEVIGLSGNSGRSSAPHLHFEIRVEGRFQDPLDYVSEGIQ